MKRVSYTSFVKKPSLEKVKIILNHSEDLVTLKYQVEGELYLADIKFEEVEPKESDYMFSWLMLNSRKLINRLPYKEIEVSCSNKVWAKCERSITTYHQVLLETNKFIKDNRSLQGIAMDWKNPLFIGIEDHRYVSFYKWLKDEIPESEYILQVLGFDSVKREWNDYDLAFSLEQLIDTIKRHKIGSLVTVNYETVCKFVSTNGIDLRCFLKYLGVELIVINNDPADLSDWGAIQRAAHHQVIRFSNMGSIGKYWDEKYSQKVKYIALPQDYREKDDAPFDSNYKIVILSNSRWMNVESWRYVIEKLLGNMENPLTELPLWYMSTHRLLQNYDVTELRLSKMMSLIHLLFYNAAQWLKYDIIKNIKTARVVEVYGDDGWTNVCPKYYKGSLDLSQLEKLHKEENVLCLLLNFGYTYLDHSGPVYDMVRRGSSWINVSPVVRTADLEGLRNIEYQNYEELNTLINNVMPAMESAQESIDSLHSLYYSSTLEMIKIIKEKSINKSKRTRFDSSFEEHNRLLKPMLESYIDKNEPNLSQIANALYKMTN